MSSSSSRRERWKARVVLTAMKTSCSRSSGDRGLGGLSPGGSCMPCGDRLEWYRRETSPMHRRVRRARPRRRRHCIGPGTPDSSAPESQQDGEARLVRWGPPAKAKGRRGASGAARRGDVGAGAPGREAEPRQPRRCHRQPSTCSRPLPACSHPDSGAPGPAPLPAQPEGRAGPGSPSGGCCGLAEGTAPAAPGRPAAAVGVGTTQNRPYPMEGRGLPASGLPRDRGLAHSTPIVLPCPAIQPPSCSHYAPSWMLPPSSLWLPLPFHQDSFLISSSRKPSLMPPSAHPQGAQSRLLRALALYNSSRRIATAG